jgi:hypothetical protein
VTVFEKSFIKKNYSCLTKFQTFQAPITLFVGTIWYDEGMENFLLNLENSNLGQTHFFLISMEHHYGKLLFKN